jgi:hypothetical protein
MFKMGLHCPFGHLKHKLLPKERSGVKLTIDPWPLKVGNWPNFFMCRQRATYCWKALDKGYNFASDLISIGGLHAKLCAFKVVGVVVVGISRLPLGSPGTKTHLDVAPVESYKVYYKGEGGGFPQVQAMVSLVCLNYLWFVLAPKVLKLCTNHPMLVLCWYMWIIEACQFLLNPILEFQHAPLPL